MTASPSETDIVKWKYLMSGTAGEIIMKSPPGEHTVSVTAALGFARVVNQTQLMGERYHLTHTSEGRFSLGPRRGVQPMGVLLPC